MSRMHGCSQVIHSTVEVLLRQMPRMQYGMFQSDIKLHRSPLTICCTAVHCSSVTTPMAVSNCRNTSRLAARLASIVLRKLLTPRSRDFNIRSVMVFSCIEPPTMCRSGCASEIGFKWRVEMISIQVAENGERGVDRRIMTT